MGKRGYTTGISGWGLWWWAREQAVEGRKYLPRYCIYGVGTGCWVSETKIAKTAMQRAAAGGDLEAERAWADEHDVQRE